MVTAVPTGVGAVSGVSASFLRTPGSSTLSPSQLAHRGKAARVPAPRGGREWGGAGGSSGRDLPHLGSLPSRDSRARAPAAGS